MYSDDRGLRLAGTLAATIVLWTLSGGSIMADEHAAPTTSEKAFDAYRRKVEALFKSADEEHRSVIAMTRVAEGSTIETGALYVAPIVEYRKSNGIYPDPVLVRRPSDEFAAVDDVAGRVALQDLEGRIKRSQVGKLAYDQFNILPTTAVTVRYVHLRHRVKPGEITQRSACYLDTATMTAPAAAELRRLIVESDVLFASRAAGRPREGSYETYTIEVAVDGATRKTEWDAKLPASIKKLVDYLHAQATQGLTPE